MEIVIEVSLIAIIAVLVALREFERERWDNQRKDLLNRIMARDWGSYLAIKQVEVELEKESHEEPPAKTKNPDQAWFM